MAGNPPALPPLPPGFGNDSSYPPHPSSRAASSTAHHRTAIVSSPPPIPPLPPGALEREQQYRAQNLRSPQPGPRPPPLPASPSPNHPHYRASSGFVPGQVIRHPSGPPLHPSGPHHYPRSPSPSPNPAHRPFPQAQPYSPDSDPYQSHYPQRNTTLSPPPPPPERPHSASSYHSSGGQGGGGAFLEPHSPGSYNQLDGGPRPGSSFQDHAMPTLSQSMSSMAFGPPPSSSHHPGHNPYARRASSSEATSSYHSQQQQHRSASPANAGAAPSLNAPLPDMDALEKMRDRAFASRDDQQQVAWAKQLLKFVERKFADGSKISEPRLVKATDEAISTIKRLASLGRPNLEALYLRGDLQASGAFPTYIRKDLKEAFNDFELSARLGYAASWFRIGRDYELLNDFSRARDAYNRGIVVGDVGSMYRLGMANLLGQLELPVNQAKAVGLLRDAADRANLDVPQPAYIYGMLLAGEFNHVDIPPGLLKPTLAPEARRGGGGGGNTKAALENEARRRIERAAYLNFAPAQYKCGWTYEYAQLDCAFDPLLSVQYYSLASQGGEVEADMALSKWFLCGAEGCFDKNEGLAFTFADKAARKGLASAEFALGYYFEVGVGTERNLETAKRWYRKAAAQDNDDAKQRLEALQAGGGVDHSLSRGDHEVNVDEKVQRKRTLAKIRSEKEGRGSNQPPQQQTQQQQQSRQQSQQQGQYPGGGGGRMQAGAMELNRKKTMRMVQDSVAAHQHHVDYSSGGVGRRYGGGGGGGGRRATNGSDIPPVSPVSSDQYGLPPSMSTTTTAAPAATTSSQVRPPPATSAPSSSSSSSSSSAAAAAAMGRHGQGYSLSDTSTPHHSSAPAGTGAGSTSSASNNSSKPPQQQQQQGGGGGGGAQAKVYSTFEEMGFKPQKAKREECVIA